MNKKTKGCLVTLAAILITPFLLVGGLRLSALRAMAKYDQCDHVALLAACRQMMANRDTYTNSPSYRPPYSWERGSVSLSRDHGAYGPEIPDVVRNLSPLYVVIRADSVIIGDPPRFPPMRRGMIAFPADAEFQYGTRQYLDGLWYWNGNIHPSVKPEFDRRMDGKIKRIEANHRLEATPTSSRNLE